MEAQSMNPSQQCMLKLELGRPCPSRILMLLSIEDQNQNPILTNLSRKVLSCLAKLNISDEFSDWAGVWVMTTNRSFRNICWVTVMSDQNTLQHNNQKLQKKECWLNILINVELYKIYVEPKLSQWAWVYNNHQHDWHYQDSVEDDESKQGYSQAKFGQAKFQCSTWSHRFYAPILYQLQQVCHRV